jgi:hypothetical protein
MAYSYIDREECIGDSLYKINNNSFNFDTRLNEYQTLIQQLSSQITFTKYETVIGSASTKSGCISGDTLAQGVTTPGSTQRLADFNWKKGDGTELVVRMENVNLATYTPWSNFFPYKPTFSNKILLRSKFFVQQPCLDASSTDLQTYTLLVDWENATATYTGSYFLGSSPGNNRVFNKRWNFTNGSETQLKIDSNVVSTFVNTLGESNSNYSAEVFYYTTVMRCKISTSVGIESIPLWTYWGGGVAGTDTRTILQETAGVSMFIENTFRNP